MPLFYPEKTKKQRRLSALEIAPDMHVALGYPGEVHVGGNRSSGDADGDSRQVIPLKVLTHPRREGAYRFGGPAPPLDKSAAAPHQDRRRCTAAKAGSKVRSTKKTRGEHPMDVLRLVVSASDTGLAQAGVRWLSGRKSAPDMLVT